MVVVVGRRGGGQTESHLLHGFEKINMKNGFGHRGMPLMARLWNRGSRAGGITMWRKINK